jgi:hypothetical protein
MRLLQFYVDDFVIEEFLFVWCVAVVVTEVKGLEYVGLVKVGMIEL